MKRLLTLFLAVVFLLTQFFVSIPTTFGESSEGLQPESSIRSNAPSSYQLQPILGQNHSYSVVFRGNGEAVVSLRVVLTNKTEKPLSEIFLRVPRVEPKNLFAFQIIKDKVCIRYGQQEYDPETRRYKPAPCEEYQEPDYYQFWGSAKYQKAQTSFEGDEIKITLPQPIKPDVSGSYLVYFRAFGYARKNLFGAYEFNFESLKVDDEINSLTVGISTDSDLVLRGARGEVSYRFEESTLQALPSLGADGAVASPLVDRFVSQIGQGSIVKTASNLAPLESYTLKGQYASTRLKLYGKEISIGTAFAIVLLIIFTLLARFLIRRVLGEVRSVKESEAAAKERGKMPMLVLSFALSFASSTLIAGYTVVLVIFLGQSLGGIVDYRYAGFIFLFLIIISFCVYLLLLFAPGIYVGYKKGIGWGIATVVLTVLWLVLYLIFAVVVLFLLGKNQGPIPIPILQRFD